MRTSTNVLSFAAGLAISNAALAQTWDGGSAASSNWTDGLNWSANVAPINNGTAAITLAGAVRTSPLVNLNYLIASLNFAAGASPFTLGTATANTLTIGGSGINHSTTGVTHTISLPLITNAAQSWTANGSLMVSGTVQLNAPLFLNPLTASTTVTLANTVSGSGSISKFGPGHLNLSGSINSTGGMTISGGDVTLLTGFVLPHTGLMDIQSGTLDLNNYEDFVTDLAGSAAGSINIRGRTLSITPTANRVLASQVIGLSNAQFHKNGAPDLAISNFNGFLGLIWIEGGTLTTVGNEVIANTAQLNINTTGQLVVNGAETVGAVMLQGGGSITGAGSLTTTGIDVPGATTATLLVPTFGSGTLSKSGTGTLVVSAPASHTGGTTITGGELRQNPPGSLPNPLFIGPAGTYTLNGPQNLDPLTGSGTVNLQTTPSVLTVYSGNFAGGINGTGKLVKSGSGTLILSGAMNAQEGLEVLNGLVIASAPNLLHDSILLTINGGGYDLLASDTVANLFLNRGQLTGPGTLAFLSSALLYQGLISANLACPANTSLFMKSSADSVTLSGDNSAVYRGIEIVQGTLIVNRDVNLGAVGVAPILGGGTLRILSPISLNRPLNSNFSGGTIDCQSDTSLLGVPGFQGTVTKTGPGTLTFGGGAPTTGGLTINQGEVDFGSHATIQLPSVFSLDVAGFCTLDGGSLSAGSVINAGSLALRSDVRINTSGLTNSGVLEGDARILGPLSNTAAGDVWINQGDRLWINSTLNSVNAGAIEVVGGEFVVDGPMTNAVSTGFIYGEDAVLRFRGGLTNAGSMLVSLGTESVYGDINNVASGAIVVSGGQSATFFDDIVNNGQIRTSAGGIAVFGGSISGAGSFPGTGSVYFEGDLRPGNSPANIVFGGTVHLGGSTSTHIEVGGLASGSQHDKMTIAGQITLDGTLQVQLVNGFTPLPGNTLTIIQAGGVMGTFASAILPRGMHISYEPSRVRLIYCPADFNDDGVVDFFDYLDFVSAFAANTDAGDFNEDGIVDLFDYLDFVSAFSIGC